MTNELKCVHCKEEITAETLAVEMRNVAHIDCLPELREKFKEIGIDLGIKPMLDAVADAEKTAKKLEKKSKRAYG